MSTIAGTITENEMTQITDISTVKNIKLVLNDGGDATITPEKLADLVLAKIQADNAKKAVLGGIIGNPLAKIRTLTSSDDANNIPDGIYNIFNANAPQNLPGANALLIQISDNFGSSTRADKIQIRFEFNDSSIAIRLFNQGLNAWTSLRTI